MKVFYTASYYGKEKYQKYYDSILAFLETKGLQIISPEKGNYRKLLPKSLQSRINNLGKIENKEIHYEAIRRGIAWADVVIIEVSHEDFQLGHEATLAIQNKKPVLCLSVNEDFSEKIKSRYFYGSKYGIESVDWIIDDFLKKVYKDRLSERLNFFLSSVQLKKLEQYALNMQVTVSEALRELIDNIDNQ